MSSKLLGKMFNDWQVVSTVFSIESNHSSYKIRNIKTGKEEIIPSATMTRIIKGETDINKFLYKRGYTPSKCKKESRYINEYERRKFEHWLIDSGMTKHEFIQKSTLSRQMVSGVLRGDLSVTENTILCFAKGGYIL